MQNENCSKCAELEATIQKLQGENENVDNLLAGKDQEINVWKQEVERLQSENSALREKVGKLTNALSAVQMLIEEDIEENNGFTFNRKRMLEKIDEVLK